MKAAAVDSQNLFTPASMLVDNAMAQKDPETLPAQGNAAQAANHLRQQLHPNEPAGYDFDISMEHIPDDFLEEDIHQLFCVHAFVKGDTGKVKQVHFTFVYMTRCRTKDYKKVLKALKRCLDSHTLRKVVMDFDWAAWKAMKVFFFSRM